MTDGCRLNVSVHCDIVNHNYRFLIVRVWGECNRVPDEHEMNYPGAGPTEIMYSFVDLVCIIIITSVLGTVEMRFKHVQVQVNVLTYNTSPVQTFNGHKP